MNADHLRQTVGEKKLLPLCIAALGVVYGDIGTSPLYALRECFAGTGVAVTAAHVIGVLSLIFWSLMIVVSLKYLTLLFRADNRGEGGILALMTLIGESRWKWIVPLAIFGGALLYGDGIITPAVSVLSAIEGLNVGTRIFQNYLPHLAVAILALLFLVQRRGSAGIGAVFGPVMVVWFVAIGVLGLMSVSKTPMVWQALDPRHAFAMLTLSPGLAATLGGAVFLAVTGGEVLYADMGHFGKSPIRFNWFILVLPALTLNYFGQGALLLRQPGAIDSLFYRMVPSALLYPMVGLATLATVIAAQAVISGTFSMTHQAIQLGLWPRMTLVHTSENAIGQIYMPEMNWFLFAGAAGLVVIFQDSGSLAGAYGTAVSGTMLITSMVALFLIPRLWRQPLARTTILTIFGFLLLVDLGFFAANIIKIRHGGWIPLLLGFLVYAFSRIWRRGRAALRADIDKYALSIALFLKSLREMPPLRVKGTAVFLSGNAGVPRILLHNLKHNKVLHEKTVLLSVVIREIPFVPPEERTILKRQDEEFGLYSITVQYGFCEKPDVPRALKDMAAPDLDFKYTPVSYFLGREALVIASRKKALRHWQKVVFIFMSRNAYDVTRFFAIPPNQVTEFGIQMEL